MTYWNLSFDYVALFGYLLIFVWMMNEAWIPMRSYRVYQWFVLTAFLSAGFEIGATLLARNMDVYGYTLFFHVLTLQTFCINLVPILFSYYVLLLANLDIRMKRVHLVYGCAVLIDLVICGLNPLLKWAFTFENERYRIAPVGVLLYVVDGVMLLVAAIVLVRYRKNFQFIKLPPLAFIFGCGVLASVFQIVFYFPAINLLVMTVALTLYHYQHNSGLVTDSVTGMFNRKFMGEYIRSLYYDKKKFGIVLIAMDDFKFINKTYGVEEGDALLRQIGAYLKKISQVKMVFRFGSDQFCVVIQKTGDPLFQIAQEMLNDLHKPWKSRHDTEIMLSASICCMQCPKDAASYSEMIEVLDYSMGEVKRLKKGQVIRIRDIDIERVKTEKNIEKVLRTAMDQDTLMVYYQPIYSTKKQGFHSAEALVRLHDEKLGWIAPADFIPIAEKNGLIIELGEMVLRKVCQFIRDSRLSETPVSFLEVNLSPIQLSQVHFAEKVISILEEYQVSPSQINFEITETSAINTVPSVVNNINKLVSYGIYFSLDDYGSGNANINYINSMSFSIVKIDRELLWESFHNHKAAVTLEYSIAMLNALNVSIVVEGVETREMRDKLVEFGCHYLQGWYYAKALPGEEFLARIKDGSWNQA